MTRRTHIGFLSRMAAFQAAQKAINAAADLGREACVLHVDRTTTRLTVYADRDTPILPNTCALGLRYDSDPDVLTADLLDERRLCGLGSEQELSDDSVARKDGRRTYLPEEKEMVKVLVEKGVPVKDAAKRAGVPYKTAWVWAKGEAA